MKTVRDLLRDADPLVHEPEWTEAERRSSRQAVLAAPRRAGRPLPRTIAAAVVALACVATVAAATRIWPHAAVVQAAAVRFEVRLAETAPAADLRESAATQSGATVYLHRDAIVTNGDIDRARMVQTSDVPEFSVLVELTAEGAAQMRRATAQHIGKPLAILIDGEIVTAPTLRGPIDTSAVIDGHYTREEAERIVAGIRGR